MCIHNIRRNQKMVKHEATALYAGWKFQQQKFSKTAYVLYASLPAELTVLVLQQ